ncbi:MAG: RES domain-containing protein [Rubellimicrobium sp.]|nr:RES domain-containing protein [Rubellimicrobium sp.]
MIPLPPPLGSGELRFWRLDMARHAATWHSGEGSFQVGGRWNSRGVRAVYASLDPATATLEVAVHKGFRVLDMQPHVLTSARIIDAATVHVVMPDDIPDPDWLAPGAPDSGQQDFGNALIARHRFVLIPSAVSAHSWNLVFDATKPGDDFGDVAQEGYTLDPRLHVGSAPG